jgi:WD40 repeat protein
MSIRIYETETGRLLRILPPPAVELIALAYSPDGTRLAWADRRYVRVLDSTSGKPSEFAAKYGWKNDPAKASPPAGGKPPAAQTQPTQPANE